MIESSGGGLFRILGPLEVWTGGEWAGIGAPKWRTLLALLLLRAGRPVATDQLIEDLWPDDPPARAGNLVSVYVHRLRRLLGDEAATVLVTRAPGYQAVLRPGDLDADRFGRLVGDGRHALAGGEPGRAADLLTTALGLWRGPALADVSPSPLVTAEAERLEESRIAALELRIEADLACGRGDDVAPELRRLLADNPLRERLWALLMRTLNGGGRQAEALEAYARAREVIAGELGVDPGPELRRLHEEILARDTAGAVAGAPEVNGTRAAAGAARPDRGAEAGRPGAGGRDTGGRGPGEGTGGGEDDRGARPPVPAQLPPDITDFTGRDGRVTQLRGLLSGGEGKASPGAVPIVVLVGSGGLGKTTLAVHAAHLLARDYPHGQLFAGLLGATQPADPAEVLARFLRGMGMNPARIPVGLEERAAQYRSLLSGRRVLIVLDDARDAAQVRPLLPGSATCAVLITARRRLPELVGSRVIDLDVLPEEDARVLFTRVAGEERVNAEPEATQQVLATCAGLPLAIRIAGARLAARGGWNVHYLAGRLSDEHRRLDELRTGNLAVRASFEVSFTSLADVSGPGALDPAHVFRLLGLWTGPSISLPGAAALLGESEADVEDALEVLVDAHLLHSPEPDRYRFHDLLRVYAADRAQAQESEQERRGAVTRLLTWYLHTTEAAARIISPQRTQVPLSSVPPAVLPLDFGSLDEALAWCDAERAGLGAATRLAAASDLHEIAWKLPAAAMSFYYRRSHWADWVAAHQIGLTSAQVSRERLAEAWMLNNLGIAYGQQRMEQSVGCFEQALALYRELGNVEGEARAANNVANACLDLRRFDDARAAAERSLVIQRQVRSRYGEGLALSTLGCTSREQGRFTEAIAHLRQALSIFREIGYQNGEADCLCDLGDAYLGAGRADDASARLRESLTLRRATGDRYGQAATLHRLGRAHALVGESAPARELLAEALALFDRLGDHIHASEIRATLTRMSAQAS